MAEIGGWTWQRSGLQDLAWWIAGDLDPGIFCVSGIRNQRIEGGWLQRGWSCVGI
jgi:hypothetical protein